MEQLIGGHIKIGGNFVIPPPYFEKILETPLQNAGIKYTIVEDITSSYQDVFHSSAVLFVEIAEDFYLDFLTNQKDNLLYALISENLNSLWLMFTEIINKNEDSIEKLSYSKFDILYSAKDNNRLHFSFSFSLTAQEERNAWIKMIDLITKYESLDEKILMIIRSIHAQKDNIRFFVYNSKELKWEILNPLLDETLRLSKEYYDYKKDKRI